jgi:hypothetical protein
VITRASITAPKPRGPRVRAATLPHRRRPPISVGGALHSLSSAVSPRAGPHFLMPGTGGRLRRAAVSHLSPFRASTMARRRGRRGVGSSAGPDTAPFEHPR